MDFSFDFFKNFALKYLLRKWLKVDNITLSPNITLSIKDGKFIIQNKGQITARTISLKLDKSFRDVVECELNKRKCQARHISFEIFCKVPKVRDLFLSESALYKEECVLRNLEVLLSKLCKCETVDEVNQLKEDIRKKKEEIAKLKKSVNSLEEFLIKSEILDMWSNTFWKMPRIIRSSEKNTIGDIQLSEFHRYIDLEEEIDGFYDKVEKAPIHTLAKEQIYPFNIPSILIDIINEIENQWICNVRYFYENGPKKGEEVPTTIVISSSTPPESPSPLSNQ